MVRKQLYIDDDLNEGLRMLAARTGKSEAEHVRAALKEYLRRPPVAAGEHDPLLDLIGLVDDARLPDDIAERHDDYLHGDRRPA